MRPMIKLFIPPSRYSNIVIEGEMILDEKEASYLRRKLHKAGIKTRPTPLDFGANILSVRHEDFSRAQKLIVGWREKTYQERITILKKYEQRLKSVV